ncbi:MAG: SulP family inorganic anion transporter [Saprospiraceae bacterium]
MRLTQYLPILEWLPRYQKAYLSGDFNAGLTVAVMLVPQGMAYGLLAGLPPIYGLYAGILPLLLYSFFGTSRQLSVGPVALVSLLILTGVGQFAEPGSAQFISYAITTALIAGIIQVLLGVFRLGFLVNFLSHPVISGFTSAAAIIIGISQLQNLMGISIPRSNRIHVIVGSIIEKFGEIHYTTLLLGILGIALIFWLKKVNKKIPGALIAVILGIVGVYFLKLNEQGVAVVGKVPQGLPQMVMPVFNWEVIRQLLPLSLTICLISFIESLAIAKTIEGKHKDYKVIPNQELFALGITKIGGAFFQSYPTTGSFTRSAINDEAGAKTGLSSIISAVVIASILLFLTPAFYYLPKAILASVIVVAVVGLINYKEAVHLWKNDRRDFLSLIVTFLATLTLGIQDGVMIGVILSLAIIIYRNSRPHVAVLGKLPEADLYRNVLRFKQAIRKKGVLIVRFDAPLYFGNAAYFRKQVEDFYNAEPDPTILFVLDAQGISDMDSSGAMELLELVRWIKNQNTTFRISGAIGPIRDVLEKFGVSLEIGANCFHLNVHSAVEGGA